MHDFWAAAASVMIRGPLTPDAKDVTFLRWGFLLLLVLAVAWAHFA